MAPEESRLWAGFGALFASFRFSPIRLHSKGGSLLQPLSEKLGQV